jgi:hypothetical protein
MTIYSFTDIQQSLPDFINISENVLGGVTVTIRQTIGRGHEDAETVQTSIAMSMDEARKMSEALKKVFDRGDYVPLGFSMLTGHSKGK